MPAVKEESVYMPVLKELTFHKLDKVHLNL